MKTVICTISLLLVMKLWGLCNDLVLSEPAIDIRVELLSVVFRLAGNFEYNMNKYPYYVQSIETYFEAYQDHELIEYARRLRKYRGVSFDAVASMAISITDKHPFEPLKPFTKEFPEKRWGAKRATRFLKLLNQFYIDTNFETFFNSHETLYKETSRRFREVYEKLDIDWYLSFYGESPKGVFKIVNAPGNGGANYGPKIELNGREYIYAIMGVWSMDSLGKPDFEVSEYFPILLHEFNHSFVNQLVDKWQKELSQSGKTLFKPLKKKMKSQAYGKWNIMYKEAIVRAAVVKYMMAKELPNSVVEDEIKYQEERGFLWTRELLEELNRYDKNRESFPTLGTFMPEIVLLFDRISKKTKEMGY